MADVKKTVPTKDAADKVVVEKAVEVTTSEVKTPEGKKETVKTETVKKEKVKKETVKKVANKPAVKKVANKPVVKKVEITTNICLQFNAKSYTNDELVKMAKDIWKNDLKKKQGDLKNIQLYVKPEENVVYYVMNEEEGSFYI